jgi:hypothetical protein
MRASGAAIIHGGEVMACGRHYHDAVALLFEWPRFVERGACGVAEWMRLVDRAIITP